jgi:hypothetical protein
MEIDLRFLPHWPPPDPTSITTGLIAIITFVFYSILLGIASILGSFILCLPICGFYLLLDRWRGRREDEEGGKLLESDDDDDSDDDDSDDDSDNDGDEYEWVLEPIWQRV